MSARTGVSNAARPLVATGELRSREEVAERFGLTALQAKNVWTYLRRYRPEAAVGTPAPAPEEAPPSGPGFERCSAAGGLRRETCERYETCLDAARRGALASAHARCPSACAWYTPHDRARELYHLAASRPGDGPTS